MNIVVTGGGTGGHVYPALAVAEALREDPQVDRLLYIGKSGGKTASLESAVVPAQGLAFEGLSFFGMPRRPTPDWFRWLLALHRATAQAGNLLKAFRPDVVFGTGGYVSAPVLRAAAKLSIPYVVHEPDAHPGLVNRWMGRKATRVTAAFAAAHALIRNPRFEVTGNPLRGEVATLCRAEGIRRLGLPWHPADRTVVVTGGSQGARSLNAAVLGCLPRLVREKGCKVIHQTGQKLFEEALAEARQMGMAEDPDYCIRPFFDDMAAVWACADLAVCRAGSMTLSELYACGVPSLLVPYPHAAANHQLGNALASQEAGASRVVEEQDGDCRHLDRVLFDLLDHPEKLAALRTACQALAHPDATGKIVAILKSCASLPLELKN